MRFCGDAITIGGNGPAVERSQQRFAVIAGDHHQLIHQGLLSCSTQAPVALVGRPHGGPPALRIRAGRSPLSLLNRPPCSTAHSGNSSTEATAYAVNSF